MLFQNWMTKGAISIILLLLVSSCEKQGFEQSGITDPEVKNALAGSANSNVILFSETFTITTKEALITSRILNDPEIANSDNFTISVRNGKNGRTKVTKMEIWVDGKLIITYKDFRGSSPEVTKNLPELTTSSKLEVKIAGSRNRFIMVIIRGIPKVSSVTDIDGNIYRTVKIGDQWWMAENLKTTKLNDGTVIPLTADKDVWLSLSSEYMLAMSWYGNDQSNKSVYGGLYNWAAAGNDQICPSGWRLPDSQDFYELCLFIDPESAMGYYSGTAGGALKEQGTTHWNSPNAGATDAYGFTALPGGSRNVIGDFENLGKTGSWWSDNGLASMHISYDDPMAGFSEGGNEYGRSIRCIKE